MNFAVITTYSFDPETVVHLFEREDSAKDFLRKSYEEELRIDTQENGFDSEGRISEEGWYASITNHFNDHDDITEFRIGYVRDSKTESAASRLTSQNSCQDKEGAALQYALENLQKQELTPSRGQDIEAEDILTGILMGAVKFVTDRNTGYGTVCSIGDDWFYFGGQTAEEESPEEYLRNVPLSDTINSILEVLDVFGMCRDTADEYAYYASVLKEAKAKAMAL